jgi:hypothetical protein
MPCECQDWKVGEPQLRSFTTLAWTHGMKYTGEKFRWCPWCGRNLTLPAPDKGDSPTPQILSALKAGITAEHEPTPAKQVRQVR